MCAERRRRLWRTAPPEPPPDPTAAADLALLRDLVHSLTRAERAEEAFQFALDRTCPVVGASFGSVFLLDGASELMTLVAEHRWPERWRPWLGDMRVRVGFGPSGEAVSERRIIEVPDVFADPGLEDWQEVATELGFSALVSLPLVLPQGVVGAVTFYFAEAGSRTSRVRDLLRAVADVMAAMAGQEALRERLRHAEAALELNEQRLEGVSRSADSGQTLE